MDKFKKGGKKKKEARKLGEAKLQNIGLCSQKRKVQESPNGCPQSLPSPRSIQRQSEETLKRRDQKKNGGCRRGHRVAWDRLTVSEIMKKRGREETFGRRPDIALNRLEKGFKGVKKDAPKDQGGAGGDLPPFYTIGGGKEKIKEHQGNADLLVSPESTPEIGERVGEKKRNAEGQGRTNQARSIGPFS